MKNFIKVLFIMIFSIIGTAQAGKDIKIISHGNSPYKFHWAMWSDVGVTGFAGDDAPRAVFPSIVGRSRYQGSISMERAIDSAYARRASDYLIKQGVVTNWDGMEPKWDSAAFITERK